MEKINLNHSAAQIDAAIDKISGLIVSLGDGIIQLKDGVFNIYPRTKAEAVYFGNDYTNTLITRLEILLNKLRGFGSTSSTYEPGKDPIFFCGTFTNSYHGDSTEAINEELNKLHSSLSDSTYLCDAMEDNLRVNRLIPRGICHINKDGTHIWFINSVDFYSQDKWTQVFFNAKIDFTRRKILNGNNIVIRTCDNGQWGDYYEIPYNILKKTDFLSQQSAAASLINYNTISDDITYNEWIANSSEGFISDSTTRLDEVYAGNDPNNFITTIDVRKTVYLRPNDIIKIRAFYRRGFARQGIEDYPNNSYAYIYVTDTPDSHYNEYNLKSDFIQVKSLGSLGVPLTEEQKDNQNLSFARYDVFKQDAEYGWHYLKTNVPVAGNYYLHIVGNFIQEGSWIVFGDGQVLTSSNLQLDANNNRISFGGKTFQLTQI